MTTRIDAVLFDLLSGLLDSWTLWNRVAGDPDTGKRWRLRYLELTRTAGPYRDYMTLVGEAAQETGLPRGSDTARDLEVGWHSLAPWPEAAAVLTRIRAGIPIGVVTNCSVSLAEQAVACVGTGFDVVVCAESSGWYKPAPEAYRAGLDAIGSDPAHTLFVAGSPFDVEGASAVGMMTAFHDRVGVGAAVATARPDHVIGTLHPLERILLGGN